MKKRLLNLLTIVLFGHGVLAMEMLQTNIDSLKVFQVTIEALSASAKQLLTVQPNVEKKIEELNKKVKIAKKSLKLLKKRISNIIFRFDNAKDMQDEYNGFKNDFEEKTVQIENLIKEIAFLEQSIKTDKDQLIKMQEEITNIKQRVENRLKELENGILIASKLSELKLNEKYKLLKKESEELEAEIQGTPSKEKLEAAIESTKKQLQEFDEALNEIIELSKQNPIPIVSEVHSNIDEFEFYKTRVSNIIKNAQAKLNKLKDVVTTTPTQSVKPQAVSQIKNLLISLGEGKISFKVGTEKYIFQDNADKKEGITEINRKSVEKIENLNKILFELIGNRISKDVIMDDDRSKVADIFKQAYEISKEKGLKNAQTNIRTIVQEVFKGYKDKNSPVFKANKKLFDIDESL